MRILSGPVDFSAVPCLLEGFYRLILTMPHATMKARQF